MAVPLSVRKIFLPSDRMAPSSRSRASPSLIFPEAGGSIKGNEEIFPIPRAIILRITSARLERSISGRVKKGRSS